MTTTIKQRPILFRPPMIYAILEGKKIMTRRIIKHQPDEKGLWNDARFPRHAFGDLEKWNGTTEQGEKWKWKCPFGVIGDFLFVKESFYAYGYWKKNGKTKTGKQKWRFVRDLAFTSIAYNDHPPYKIEKNSFRSTGWYKRSPLFMPKAASRIQLQITEIRVEKLQDISEGDSIYEGIDLKKCSGDWEHPPTSVFQELWESINGPKSWDVNPWVWVIEFEKINKP